MFDEKDLSKESCSFGTDGRQGDASWIFLIFLKPLASFVELEALCLVFSSLYLGGPKEQGVPEQLLGFFCLGACWEVSETTE